jgi:hypothetical protein
MLRRDWTQHAERPTWRKEEEIGLPTLPATDSLACHDHRPSDTPQAGCPKFFCGLDKKGVEAQHIIVRDEQGEKPSTGRKS